jgi:hypothetical protein
VDRSLLSDFQLDWRLAGKAEQTAKNYVQHLNELLDRYPNPSLSEVKTWLTQVQTPVARRKRGQAVRAFGKWAQDCEYDVFNWWKQVPLAREPQRPQQTVTEADYKKALTAYGFAHEMCDVNGDKTFGALGKMLIDKMDKGI